jgi:hypothetical protein
MRSLNGAGRPGPPGPHDVALADTWLELRVLAPGATQRAFWPQPEGQEWLASGAPAHAKEAAGLCGGRDPQRRAWHALPLRPALAGTGVSASGDAAQYEIRVAGVLDSRWAAWFNGLHISGQGDEAVICGLVADQPALHGLLTKIRDLGLCLISVRRLDTGQAETRHHDQRERIHIGEVGDAREPDRET